MHLGFHLVQPFRNRFTSRCKCSSTMRQRGAASPLGGPAAGTFSAMTAAWLLPYTTPGTQVGASFTQMEKPSSFVP